jgi:hypothetical protein
MRLRLFAVALLALLAAGCGGGGGGSATGGTGGATKIPKSAPLVISLNTDFNGSEIKQLLGLAKKFPGRDLAYARFRQALSKQSIDFDQDVKPALGPETDIVFLDFQHATSHVVVISKPPSKAKFTALAKKGKNPSETVDIGDGWMAACDDQAVLARYQDELKSGKLADLRAYKDATKDLPSDALAKLYVDGATVMGLLKKRGVSSIPLIGELRWLSGDLAAEPNGLALHLHAHGKRISASSYSSDLVSQVPAGTLAFVSFSRPQHGIESIIGVPQLSTQLSQFEAATGVPIDKIVKLFGGEGALYARTGTPLPEITLALKEVNERDALSTIDTLASRLSALLGGGKAPQPTAVDGVAAKKVDFGRFSIFYAAFESKLVLSDATTGISGLKESGPKLADDPVFKEATKAAGMPDRTSGFVYVNLRDSIPVIEGFAQLAGRKIPQVVAENLAPLRAFVLYTTVDSDTLSVKGFLQIK